MAVIVTFKPLAGPTRVHVHSRGRLVTHRCEDQFAHKHRQRFPLGSVKGVVYLDALCLHCGAHLVWVEEEDEASSAASPNREGEKNF